jgi:superfamily I DNA/RNA helicase
MRRTGYGIEMAGEEGIEFATEDVAVYIAAAGAGKTSAIMDEMTMLLKVYRPDEIAFVTFTRKGVAHGKERALQANPQLAVDDLVHFKTLHALCFRELGLKPSDILTPKDIVEFNERQRDFKLTLRKEFEKNSQGDQLLARYDVIRSGGKRIPPLPEKCTERGYDKFVNIYEGFKNTKEVVDFTDCLIKFRDRNKPVNVKAAFIDEAQDLTPLQWEVCRIAFSTAEKIRIAGDDYQSLFTYSGAAPEVLIALSKRYREVKLEKSYRLPKAVYRFAKGVTQLIGEKVDKDFKPVKEWEGFVEEISDRTLLVRRIQKDIADNGLKPYRWYLLFRNNCFIDEMTGLLEQYTIPYHTARGFCIPETDLVKIKRFYNYRKKGFGSEDVFDKFCKDYDIKDINKEFTESNLIPLEKRYLYFSYVKKFGIDAYYDEKGFRHDGLTEMANKEPFLLLSTTHRVKGGEADFVVTFLDCTQRVARNADSNMDEELRVLYVACTRAKLGLFLAASGGKYGLDKVINIVKEQIV